jgi:hypothetical protein
MGLPLASVSRPWSVKKGGTVWARAELANNTAHMKSEPSVLVTMRYPLECIVCRTVALRLSVGQREVSGLCAGNPGLELTSPFSSSETVCETDLMGEDSVSGYRTGSDRLTSFLLRLNNRLVTLKGHLMTVERGIVVSSLSASALALCMLALALVTHVAQEYFELVHPASVYASALVDQDGPLRLAFSFDNLFLLAYSTFFALFCVERWERAPRLLVIFVAVFGLSVAVLDMVENHHILTMLAQAKAGVPPTPGEISFQVFESAIKFHLSYLALIFAAFIYPRETLLGRLVAVGTGVGYPLLGVAIFTAPMDFVPLLSLGRVLFFVVGLAASGVIYAQAKPVG